MIQVSKVDVWGFEHAIRGMRNPKNSWDKSDSKYLNYCDNGFDHPNYQKFQVGPNDLALMHKLFKAGPEHRKYLRQILVSMDILAPLYWWKEADTYKIGTTANSTSTMHKIASKEFVLSDFSTDHLFESSKICMNQIIDMLNVWRTIYINGGSSDEDPIGQSRLIFQPKNKEVWWQLIQLLPSSYNQLRTVTMTYENVFNIIHQRSSHKLDEWREFVDLLWNLPYVKQIYEGEEDK